MKDKLVHKQKKYNLGREEKHINSNERKIVQSLYYARCFMLSNIYLIVKSSCACVILIICKNIQTSKEVCMKRLSTGKAPQAIGPYSQAIVSGDLVFVSGQLPINPDTGVISATDITTQTEQIIKNIKAILEEAGSSLSKVVKTTCYITNMLDFRAFNEVYAEYFTEKPARACVEVSKLPKNALVEIEAIAER